MTSYAIFKAPTNNCPPVFAILAHAHLGRIQKSLEHVTRAFMPSPCYINRTRLQRNGMTNRIGKSSKADIKEGNVPLRCSLLFAFPPIKKKKKKGFVFGRSASSNTSILIHRAGDLWKREALFIIFLSMRRDVIDLFYIYIYI